MKSEITINILLQIPYNFEKVQMFWMLISKQYSQYFFAVVITVKYCKCFTRFTTKSITVLPWLERPRIIKLTKFSLVVLMEGTYYTRKYGMRARYYTIVLEGGRTIQGDVLIKESALN